jgi:pimeloyl-ACP methyl ester carboxylesterase
VRTDSTVASDGLTLHVEAEGPDDGPTAVLVHGFSGSIELQWRGPGAIDRLTSRGIRCVAYDLRGHGRSDKPHTEDAYGDDRMAEDLAEVVAAHGADLVVGYSMGAGIVLRALAAGLRARGAVAGATAPAVLGWTHEMDATSASAVRALRGDDERDELLQGWIAVLDALGEDREALACVLARHRPVVEGWEWITVPTIVVAGDEDVMAAPPADIAGRLPAGRAVSIPGDHLSTPSTAAFTDLVVDLAHEVCNPPF